MIKRSALLLLIILVSLVVSAQESYPKASPSLSIYLNNLRNSQVAKSQSRNTNGLPVAADRQRDTVSVLIAYNDEAALTNWLTSRGCSIGTRLGHSLTAMLPADSIESLLALSAVKAVSAFNHRRPLLNKARQSVSADNVHEGLGLDAPYTGKGVIIGIIDQGFQYTHPAFRKADGNSRFVAAWQSEAGKNHTALTSSAQIIRKGNDGLGAVHATPVAGIAAGGRDAASSEHYGLAPDADLVAVPCLELEDSEVIDGINYIAKVAKQQGKPFVVNMSFGTMASTHNGRDQFAQSVAELAANGAIMVAACGNDGEEKVHARAAFQNSSDSVMLYIRNNGDPVEVYFVSEGGQPFTIHMYKYNTSTMTVTPLSEREWDKANSSLTVGSEPVSGQPYAQAEVDMEALYPGDAAQYQCIAFSLKGIEGAAVNAWICDDLNEWGEPFGLDPRFSVEADDQYCIASPADAPGVIAVSAYNARDEWVALNGHTYSSSSIKIGEHAYYASNGPLVNSDDMKPTVTAPGSFVISPVFDLNGYYSKSSAMAPMLADKVDYGSNSFYYATENGTSMASPMVAGAIALWLEANPALTPAEVQDVLRQTSRADAYTGFTPNSTWGYGKIDVYEGLKQVLLISRVQSERNTAQPFTLQSYPDHWSVLFNTDEDKVTARLLSANGLEVWSQTLHNPNRGQDIQVPLSGLSQGIYILQLRSTNATITRKIIVK